MIKVLDFLFPKRCVNCKKLGSYICSTCQQTIKLQSFLCPECDKLAIDGITHPKCVRPFGLDGLTTVFENKGVIKKAIKTLKYRWVSDLAESLIDLIPHVTWENLPIDKTWIIYPIPLHPDRFRWRGFNQAHELVKYLSEKLNISLVDNFLVRQPKRTPQADIKNKPDRIKNAQRLFVVTTKIKADLPLNILLVDDVWTTGATMKEATKVLKRNGVKKVWGMTLAR